MKKLLLSCIALLTIFGGGANSAKADEVKHPMLLLKNGAINTTDFDITPISPSTLSTDNLYAATFTSIHKTSNLFQYQNLDVSAYDKIVIRYTITDANEWRVNTPTGHYALPSGTDKTYEIDLSGVDNYEDFTVFSSFQNHTEGSSITISEVYFVKSEKPQQESKLVYEYDYSDKTAYEFYTMTLPEIVNGVLTVNNDTEKGAWEVQYFVGDGVPTKFGNKYIIRATIKGSTAGSLTCNFGDWGEAISKRLDFTNEWSEVDVTTRGLKNSAFIVFQSGNFAGKIELKKIQVFEIENEQVIDQKIHEVDYTTLQSYEFWGKHDPTWWTIGVENKVLKIENTAENKGNWEAQYFVDDNIPTNNGKDYVLRIKIKGSKAGSLDCQMGSWNASSSRKLNFTDEWQTIDHWFFDVPASSSHITFQSGGFVGTIEIEKVEVYSVKSANEDPLLPLKEELQAIIDKGNTQNSFAKTTDSWNDLTNAIAAGEAALADEDATEESLTTAKTAISDAIAGLKLKDGYTNLTAAMFKEHASTAIDAAITGNAGCSYVINKASDLPYGDGSVSEKKWADLAEFSQFIAVSANDIPRFCMNRMEAGANHNDTKAEAKFVDIKATESTWWEVVDYLTIDESKDTVD